ncbi:O-antigen polymerase [Terribacillus halophilus]|uniref:O-antigen polymerase n=1 Tax=Terribacillus halophilus TaxID=361279 RepID=UPI0009859A5C|nr:O-antigen polymerase [Terribacillus halophilus]
MKRKVKNINPFFMLFSLTLIVIVFYNFNLSRFYPALSLSMFIFLGGLLITLLIYSLVYSIIFKSKMEIEPIRINKGNLKKSMIFLIVGYIMEFIYSRQIPLLNTFLDLGTNYKEFGIPTFHVFLVTFNVFISNFIILTGQLTQSKNRKRLFNKSTLLYIISLLPFILIVSRGLLVITITISFFILLSFIKIDFKKCLWGSITIIIAGFLFGLMGNARLNSDYNYETTVMDSKLILMIGGANGEMWNNDFTNLYFWTYLYATSPIANLQNAIDLVKPGDSFGDFFITQLTPDFVSDRLVNLYNIDPSLANSALITPELTVGTQYIGSYVYYGWVGVIITAAILILSLLAVLILLRQSNPFMFIIGNAVICTILILSLFENMFMFAGLFLPLVYCLMFTFVFKKILLL